MTHKCDKYSNIEKSAIIFIFKYAINDISNVFKEKKD